MSAEEREEMARTRLEQHDHWKRTVSRYDAPKPEPETETERPSSHWGTRSSAAEVSADNKEGGTGTSPIQHRPRSGDRLLICSDGVTGGADDPTIAKLLSSGTDPQKTAEAIVQAATDGGSKDNITGVVIFVE